MDPKTGKRRHESDFPDRYVCDRPAIDPERITALSAGLGRVVVGVTAGKAPQDRESDRRRVHELGSAFDSIVYYARQELNLQPAVPKTAALSS